MGRKKKMNKSEEKKGGGGWRSVVVVVVVAVSLFFASLPLPYRISGINPNGWKQVRKTERACLVFFFARFHGSVFDISSSW